MLMASLSARTNGVAQCTRAVDLGCRIDDPHVDIVATADHQAIDREWVELVDP